MASKKSDVPKSSAPKPSVDNTSRAKLLRMGQKPNVGGGGPKTPA